jgi:hypothetical protein
MIALLLAAQLTTAQFDEAMGQIIYAPISRAMDNYLYSRPTSVRDGHCKFAEWNTDAITKLRKIQLEKIMMLEPGDLRRLNNGEMIYKLTPDDLQRVEYHLISLEGQRSKAALRC